MSKSIDVNNLKYTQYEFILGISLFLHSIFLIILILMRLHIFNPEHDLALAYDLCNYTAPTAAIQLRCSLGFIPVLWADNTDAILVDDAASAQLSFNNFLSTNNIKFPSPNFIERSQLHDAIITEICPWGWDRTLKFDLMHHGIKADILPNDQNLVAIRTLSNRKFAANVLAKLRCEGTVGEAFSCVCENEIFSLISKYSNVVLKAAWSCSGRGVRFIDTPDKYLNLRGWIKNMLKQQGNLIVEPYYKKIVDFGMEFYGTAEGKIDYCGLSIFNTTKGAYCGNLIVSEQAKINYICNFISERLLQTIKEKIQLILSEELYGHYVGPFGIDMMIVESVGCSGYYLHPCVEINLRRTMGHVALALYPHFDGTKMTIITGKNYKLKIEQL